jgi:hypothetical protein
MMNLSVALFERVRLPLVGLPHGRDRVTSTRCPAFTTTVRVVDRVHHDTADRRALAHVQRVRPALPRLMVAVVGVRHRAYRRHAFALADETQFARIETGRIWA